MNWKTVAAKVLAGGSVTRAEALAVLASPAEELLAVLDAAFAVRRRYFGLGVSLHVIRNAKSGLCSEDCAYCSQASKSTVPVSTRLRQSAPRLAAGVNGKATRHSPTGDTGLASAEFRTDAPRLGAGCFTYPMQSVDDIIQGARDAQALKAIRYCIVTSGRAPLEQELSTVCEAARRIRQEMPIQLCASLGLVSADQARRLKQAGIDRFNHNLETSERFYPTICTTHHYRDRVETARTVKAAGLELCSGGLMGMGETPEDRVDLAFALRAAGADSIPVNFLDPRPGTALEGRPRLSAAEGLRILAMFRLVNPECELRIAGGREVCLGALQVLALYPANSIFTNGYLTTPGQGHTADIAMIEAAGFHVTDSTI